MLPYYHKLLMKQQGFSISKRLKSFIYAFNGLRILLKEEHNARIHLLVSILVVAAGFIFKVTTMEWIALILVMGFVIALEIINSSIENIADFISPDKHPQIKKIKDLGAAAVLVGAISAIAVGAFIFLPKIF